MATIFGLDFGTTNSVATIIGRNGSEALVLSNLEDSRPHPSVVWYNGATAVVGRKAKAQLAQLGLGVFGDIVRSPKMFLGLPTGIHVGGVNRPAVDVVAEVLRFLREDALSRGYEESPFDRAVFTIPVSMPGRARRDLRRAANLAGLKVHQFVHEPLAALYGHLRARPNHERELSRLEGRLALVFDWDGGTLDLTLCRFRGGALVQVLNVGDPDVGGDRFDLRLVQLVKGKHEAAHPQTNWATMQPTAEARLIEQCEDAKIALSTKSRTHLFVRDILSQGGNERHLDVELSAQEVAIEVQDLVSQGLRRISELMTAAGIRPNSVEFCLATGGMAAMPAIRHGLMEIFGSARLHDPNNAATVISEGAAWIAHDNLSLRLAKPLEILHGGNDHVAVIHRNTELPGEGKQIRRDFAMYCVDPRDGFAKFLFTRPQWPERESSNDPRLSYTHLTVEVDPGAPPLQERLHVEVTIDQDLIATVSALSEGRGDAQDIEIHDLEFGLGIRPLDAGAERPRRQDVVGTMEPPAKPAGAVRVRSNVTGQQHAWDLVPGEVVQKFNPSIATFQMTPLQRAEKMYYQPCCLCDRTSHLIERDGCQRCAERGHAISPDDAKNRRAVRMRIATSVVF